MSKEQEREYYKVFTKIDKNNNHLLSKAEILEANRAEEL